jgi:CheY-like chemotaxis protein
VGKGTGLGLATVYGIVKQHDGWIEVETRENVGTTFTIFFPATAERPSAQKTSPQSPHAPRGHETILVVEDEEPLRELVSEILRRSGYTVLVASTANEALEVWSEKKHEIDLLLTDIMMPEGISGRDLAERILAEQPEIKVLYTSGYPKEVIGPDLFAEGQYFLQKPYHPSALGADGSRMSRCGNGESRATARDGAFSVA